MINYQGIPVNIHAHSKTDPLTVKIKYAHGGIVTVKVEDLFVQSFDAQNELNEALRTSPFYFDKEGLHENVFTPEPVVEEKLVTVEVTKTTPTKKVKGTKYPVDVEVLKEMLSKGMKTAAIAKHFNVPYWKIGQVMKNNGIK
jgi:hypothetical protein